MYLLPPVWWLFWNSRFFQFGIYLPSHVAEVNPRHQLHLPYYGGLVFGVVLLVGYGVLSWPL